MQDNCNISKLHMLYQHADHPPPTLDTVLLTLRGMPCCGWFPLQLGSGQFFLPRESQAQHKWERAPKDLQPNPVPVFDHAALKDFYLRENIAPYS